MIPSYVDQSRMGTTWKELIPRKDFDRMQVTDENEDEYAKRIALRFPHIPREVLIQWTYEHIFDEEMIANYAWIDYSEVTFTEALWTHEQIRKIQVYSGFRDWVESCATRSDFSAFSCVEEDKRFWQEYGTWRVPIIVLHTSNLKNVPNYSELNTPYQLVEGHTRFGYYQSFYRYSQTGQFQMPERHRIFLMEL